jgi:predicted nucleotidyltransferase
VRYYCDMNVGTLQVADETLRDFCRRWGVAEFAVFGSVLRDDFRTDSDVDVLVTWEAGVKRTYFDLLDMKDELGALFGRDIDIAQRHVVEADRNPYRRKGILESARTLYAA